MIEELEAEAVAQLVAAERGDARARATLEHQGTTVEVRARRRKDGAVVLRYGYGGERLERAVLLLLMCPETACERSQSAKRRWEARDPTAPALQRRTRSPMKGVPTFEGSRLFEEVSLESSEGHCVARPASFASLTVCPVKAHLPTIVRKSGWDLFRNGTYIAGGLTKCGATGVRVPLFPTIKAASAWISSVAK